MPKVHESAVWLQRQIDRAHEEDEILREAELADTRYDTDQSRELKYGDLD